MGVVYAAFDPQLDRRVALKVLRVASSDDDDALTRGRARLLREAKALAQLAHPNVVPVFDAGEYEGRVFLAMEHVEGRTLDRWAAERPGGAPRTWTDRVRAIIDAAHGLAAAHERGLVHRDVKPANIMIGDDDRVRVMDFGLARAETSPAVEHAELTELGVDSEISIDSPITRAGAIVGTPAYMSPEQITGVSAGPKSDQFALCVVAYELLYGQRPFAGKTLAQVAEAVLDGEILEPGSGAIPRPVLEVIKRGLSSQPKGRHDDLTKLIEALEAAAAPPAPRRFATGVALISLPLIGALAFYAGRENPEAETVADPCADAGRGLDAIWNEAHETEITAALTATRRSHAAATARLVSTQLDAYAREFTQVAQTACREEDGLPEALRVPQALCLERATVRIDALVRVLAAADERTADRAASAIADVPLPRECALPSRLAGEPLLPEDESSRAEIEKARSELARLQALADTGHHPQTLEPAKRLNETATALSWPPLQVEAGWRLGAAQERTGARDEAETTLRRTYAIALEHERDADAIRLAGRLSYLLGNAGGRADEGAVWRDQALALAARLGDEQARGGVLNSAASVRLGLGDYEGAVRDWAEALEIRTKHLGPDHPRLAGALYNLGIGYDALGETDKAREHWERSLELRKQLYGEDHPFIADSLDVLAIATKKSGDMESAMRLYRDALDRRERMLGADHPDVAMSLTNIGAALTTAGRHDEAAGSLERAVQILETRYGAEFPDLSHPLDALADVQRAMGQRADAVATRTRALELVVGANGADHPRAVALREALKLDQGAPGSG
jgi:tetratricopeptide (TPR) repeat protein